MLSTGERNRLPARPPTANGGGRYRAIGDRSAMRLRDFSVLTFDGYGTLIDGEEGLLAALAPWRQRPGIAAADRDILEALAAAHTREG